MHRQRKKLTKDQVKELEVAQDSSSDKENALRYQAVRLYGTGYPVNEIESICGCSRVSLMKWNRKYHQVGVIGLLDQRQGGNRAYLSSEQKEKLQGLLHQYRPNQLFAASHYEGDGQFWTVASLSWLIEREYGVRYKCLSSYHQLFDQCDFSYQRPTQQYLSRNEQNVMAFEEELEKN